MRIMGTEEKQENRHAEQKLLGRGILIPIVDLLPHVEIVIGTSIELKRDTPHPMKHNE